MLRQAMEGRLPGSGLAAKAAREKADLSQVACALILFYRQGFPLSVVETYLRHQFQEAQTSAEEVLSCRATSFKSETFARRQGPQPLAEENGQSRSTKSCLGPWPCDVGGQVVGPGMEMEKINTRPGKPGLQDSCLGPKCDGKAERLVCAHIPAKSVRRKG